jgi:hypothetical protein
MKDGRLGKGYSYFFALLLVGLMFVQCIRLETTFSTKDGLSVKIQMVEIPVQVALAEISIIAYLLGFSTDKLADKIAGFLGYKKEDESG